MTTERLNSDHQKTAYCHWFSLKHKHAFRPHWNIGETLGRKEGRWRNVSEHCLVVGMFADILAEAGSRKGLLTQRERENTVCAALLHDWAKKIEVRLTNEKRSLDLPLLDGLDELQAMELRILCRLEFPQETIHLSQVNDPTSPQGPQTLPEMIVWYVDAIMQNTTPLPIEERLSGLERGWDGTHNDPERARRNIGRSEALRERLGGLSEYEYVRITQKRVEPFLATLMDFSGESSDLPFYLKEKFEERVRNFSL